MKHLTRKTARQMKPSDRQAVQKRLEETVDVMNQLYPNEARVRLTECATCGVPFIMFHREHQGQSQWGLGYYGDDEDFHPRHPQKKPDYCVDCRNEKGGPE